MTAGEKYVAAAYLVVLAAVLAYVVIMATKLARLERDVSELVERVRRPRLEPESPDEHSEAAVRSAVRVGEPVEGLGGNREVPPGHRSGARG